MSLIDSMKERIKNSGANKKEVLYVAPDTKRRIRFLQELDSGLEFRFHSSFNKGINALCPEMYGKTCPYCGNDDESMKENTMYAFSVFDYDSNGVKILLYKANGVSPLPSFIEYFDEYGTIMDRDYTIKKNGKGMSGSFTVMAGDRTTFRNAKAKPYTKSQIIKVLQKAFPVNQEDYIDDDEEEEEEVKPAKKTKKEKKEKTIQEKLSELELSDLKEIAIELGVSKKELKGLEEEEIIELLTDDNEEDDLIEAYNDYMNSDDEDEEEDDE